MKKLIPLDRQEIERALFRNMFTKDYIIYKSEIGSIGYYDPSLYLQLNNAIYKGIYTPEQPNYEGKHIIEEVKAQRNMKTDYSLVDYMNAFEIRLNAQAVFIAAIRTHNLHVCNQDTRQNLVETCFRAGRIARSEAKHLRLGGNKLDLSAPIIKHSNSTLLVKKFETRVKRGEIDREIFHEKTRVEKDEAMEKALGEYRQAFEELRREFIYHGIYDQDLRKDLHNRLDTGFYQTSLISSYGINIKYLLSKENWKELVSLKDLLANTYKYNKAIDKMREMSPNDLSQKGLLSRMYNVGADARKQLLLTTNEIPETFTGFLNAYYLSYIKEVENKFSKPSPQKENPRAL